MPECVTANYDEYQMRNVTKTEFYEARR